MDKEESKQSKVIKEEVAFCKKWFGIKHITYSIGERVLDNYESAYRPMRNNKFSIDGVEIMPIIKRKDRSLDLIMIANYRPPIGKFSLEFPAGIVEDADFQENARRQLKEETGYTAEKILKIPQVVTHCDPWKSSEAGILYVGVINEQDPNHHQKQDLEETENIRVFTFKIEEGLPQKIHQFAESNDYAIFGRAWAIILGLSFHRFL